MLTLPVLVVLVCVGVWVRFQVTVELMLPVLRKEFTDSARGGRVTLRVQAVTLHDCP